MGVPTVVSPATSAISRHPQGWLPTCSACWSTSSTCTCKEKQAHWNVVGKNFRDLHLQLDEVVDAAREAADTIAERMRALDAVPDGRSDTVVATTSVPQFPAGEHDTADVVDLITIRVYATVDTVRAVHDAVDAEDPSTADLLHQIIDSLEKLAWMVKAENRKI
jgi:starvation-inducible DNA-binding protein